MAGSLADKRVLLVALAAEGGLAVVAWGVCWFFSIPLLGQFAPAGGALLALGRGVLAAAPMVIFFLLLLRARWRPLARLRRQVRRLVRELLDGAGLGTIVLVSIAAGLGEEALFRGALQPALGQWLGPWGGVAAAAVCFGLAHPMSAPYVVVAAIGGFYLGAVTLLSGELITATVAHALYDMFALWRLRSRAGGGRQQSAR